MKYKVVVEYEYPVEHKPPVKAELALHGDRVETWNIKPLEQEPILDKIKAEILEKCFDVPYKNQAFDYGLKIVKWSDVREVLDKYKAESEDKE